MGSGISILTKAHETLSHSIKSTSSTSFHWILALQASCSYRNIKINPDPILRHLIIWLRSTNIPPINASITSTILKHQPQRLSSFRIVRAARASSESKRAPWQMPAEIASTVTRRITVLRKTLTEHGLRLNDHVILTAVEEHVLILRRKLEACASVQAERPSGAKTLAVVAVPHEGVSDHNVWISIAQVANLVFS